MRSRADPSAADMSAGDRAAGHRAAGHRANGDLREIRGARLARLLTLAILGPLVHLVADDGPISPVPEGMVLIPAGDFMMGRTKLTDDDKTGMRPLILRDDLPVHKVWLDAYFMDANEVTHADYAKFIEARKHPPPYHWLEGKYPESHELYPVFNVSWDDAGAYCGWQGKRLPTEAEWKRAARGDKEARDYPFGDNIDSKRTLYNVATGSGPVGEFSANGLGLYDMAGSVSEWCSDWFERTYYAASPERNPRGPEKGLYKIIRGGAWSDGPKRVTVFFRNWVRANQRTPNLGFRCAQDAAR